MTNEQTQAEKLAELQKIAEADKKEPGAKYTFYKYVQPNLEWLINETQATAELREENERLGGQIEGLANFIMSSVPSEPSQNQGAVDTAIRVIGNLQAQVAALVNAGSAWLKSTSKDEDNAIGLMKDAIYRTQATADAYTAKVRRETIEECVAAIENEWPNSILVLKVSDFNEGIKEATRIAKSLLAEPAEAAGRMDFKTWRESLDYTQSALAKRIGVTQAAISQFETGERKPSLEVFAKLVRHIPVSPKFLLEMFHPEIMKEPKP